jgi:hypothetical protein
VLPRSHKKVGAIHELPLPSDLKRSHYESPLFSKERIRERLYQQLFIPPCGQGMITREVEMYSMLFFLINLMKKNARDELRETDP